jgi:RNA polymerase sigma-70 factor, ECF subfamily
MKALPSQNMSEQDFLAAYDAYSDELFRFCILKTRNRDEALDLVQETFTRAWDYLRRGKTIEQIRPFLYRVARNLIIDQSRKRDSVSLDELAEDRGFDQADEQDPEFGHSLDRERVLIALEGLEPIHREILTLRFLQELEIREIASALNLSQNAVSVRVNRGIQALREIYLPDNER